MLKVLTNCGKRRTVVKKKQFSTSVAMKKINSISQNLFKGSSNSNHSIRISNIKDEKARLLFEKYENDLTTFKKDQYFDTFSCLLVFKNDKAISNFFENDAPNLENANIKFCSKQPKTAILKQEELPREYLDYQLKSTENTIKINKKDFLEKYNSKINKESTEKIKIDLESLQIDKNDSALRQIGQELEQMNEKTMSEKDEKNLQREKYDIEYLQNSFDAVDSDVNLTSRKNYDKILSQKSVKYFNKNPNLVTEIGENVATKNQTIDWHSKFVDFENKWHYPELAKLKVKSQLENLKQMITAETDWVEISGIKKMVVNEMGKNNFGYSGLFGIEHDYMGGKEDNENKRKNRVSENNEELEMVDLTLKERLLYAQMVRYIEEKNDVKSSETTNEYKKWDKEWPRYILPDGTEYSEMDNEKAIEKWKERKMDFENSKKFEKRKNEILTKQLLGKTEELSELCVLAKLLLQKLKTKNQKILNFNIKTTSKHAFLANFESELLYGFKSPKSADIKGGASSFLGKIENFVKISKKEIDDFSSKFNKTNKSLENEKLVLETKDVIYRIEDIIFDIKDQKIEKIKTEKSFDDYRLENEKYPNTGYRMWPLIAKRQQALFEAIPENQIEIKRKISDFFFGAKIDKENNRLILPKNRVKTNNKEIDDHFEKLVDAINSAGELNDKQRMQFFSKIPSTIGGPGKNLPELDL